MQPSRGPSRIRAGGIREPVLFAPGPDREAQAYEGGEEIGEVEVERPWSVTVAQRKGEVGPRAETLDLNRARGCVDCRTASRQPGMGREGQGHERVGGRLRRCPGTQLSMVDSGGRDRVAGCPLPQRIHRSERGDSLALQCELLGPQTIAGQLCLEGIALRRVARRVARRAELDRGVEKLPLVA